MSNPNDPFEEKRRETGVLPCEFQGEKIPMILRHEDVKKAAKEWETYSSDSPFRVPIPSEENLRTMRQLPIETDPPDHTDYRAIVEPFFKRHRDPEMIAKVEALIERLLDEALESGSVEIVERLALPVQCHALTYLLNVPESEADTFVDWGIHVFDKHGGTPGEMDSTLEDYLEKQFDRAVENPGDDFFSTLTKAEFRGRKLTREEMMGFGNLTFAGGRDTIIHTISSVVAYFAKHPEALDFLREDRKRIPLATEEFFRVATPLTHIGRVCPVKTDVLGEKVPADGRVSLCWVSANHDESVFPDAAETKLDRKPNPHIAFGAGAHFCLGAGHARLIVKTLIQTLCDKVASVELGEARELVEEEAEYQRVVGYTSLNVKLEAL